MRVDFQETYYFDSIVLVTRHINHWLERYRTDSKVDVQLVQ